jgi:hypothetical protein
MPDSRPPAEADDLFDKLDSLISKHQGTLAGRTQPPGVPVLTESVPVLTESVEAARRAASDIPVLDQAVELSPERAAMAEKRRQLQVALYLRLRQRLDAELSVALATHPAFSAAQSQPELARVIQALRAALPQIVRESVTQVLGPDAAGDER